MRAASHRPAAGARRAPSRSPSWVEVDLAAVRHNVRRVRRLLGRPSLLAVVKANAYGHGASPVARAALSAGAAGLAVASLAEGAALREAGIEAPILLLNAGDRRDAPEVVALGLTQSVCAAELARALSRAATRLGTPAQVHLKLDTGMGRLGVQPDRAVEFGQLVEGLPGVRIDGVFSHLATAEAEDTTYAHLQYERYRGALCALAQVGIRPVLRHLANSAATLRFPEMRFDAVRTGLLVYGLSPEAPGLEAVELRPALRWKTRVAFVQVLPAGRPVSYSGTYVTKGNCRAGVLPIGYADGFPRQAGNRAQVLVRGTRCAVIGTVCMDHVMVDLTPAGGVEAGEEVVIIGTQGKARITANQVANWAGTVVHETPTVIGGRVARCYLNERRPAQTAGRGKRT